MSGTSRHGKRSRLSRLIAMLEARPDSEHELTLSRLALSLIAFLCLFAGYLRGGAGQQSLLEEIGLYFLLFTGVTIALFAHLCWRPGVSVMRRLIGIPLDIGGVAYLMHRGDELTAFTYPIFLWAIFGNGFRFGVNYLFVAAGVGFACFLAVITTTPFWSENRELSGGLLAGIVILPIYVSILIRRLSEAKRQAEAASRAKSLFLASISHELRTPLNAVIGLSDMLVGGGLDRKQSDMARTIGRSGRSLLSLINSLLDVSRMELGKKPQMGAFDLHALLRDIRSMLSVQATGKGIRLALHIDPALPRQIVGSTRHFEEVLINLAGNAVKFTSHGYVLIEAKLVGSELQGAHRMRFEVTDTGIGIAPEAQAVIFESFTQADETIIDRFGGTGLGLSIARQLVEAHGGEIGVISEVGKGSTFWFEMEAGIGEVRADQDASDYDAQIFTLDPAMVAKVQASGCATQGVHTLEALFDMLRQEPTTPQIVLIDERMIEADRRNVLSALDHAEASPARTCLLVSADPGRVERDVRRRFHSILPAQLDAAALRHMLHLAAAGECEPDAPLVIAPVSRPLDILVAEDNRTNQMVIAQILARGGHRTTMVDNGDKAVDALLQDTFDLVLMDINMPVMNGLDASKFYQFAMLGQKATPIIALTADATPETAAKCREAGMADCLNKPIEANALLSVVAKYAAMSEPRDVPAPAQEAPPTAPAALAAMPAAASIVEDPVETGPLDPRALRDLETLGGADFVTEIVTQFVADAAGVLQRLAESVAEQDVDGFRDHAHALRSCAANVGAQAVYKMCLDLRAIEAHELAADGERHVRELETRFEQARAALADHVA
ncbi:MAG: rpfC 1 [Hyphomicrobiales bacterium]|nr:rpfC 1 [Hyphomicrobiales bacterium]